MRALRSVAALLLLGRLVLAVVQLVRSVLPRRTPEPAGAASSSGTATAPVPDEDRAPRTGRGATAVRAVLVAGGVLFIAAGLGLTASGVPSRQWPGILLWLAAAVVLHDGVLAPVVVVGTRAVRRGSTRLPWGALAAVQVLTVVGVAVTLLVIPALGTRAHRSNPTVDVFDYPVHLAVAWALVGAGVAAAIVIGRVVQDRRRSG